MSQQTLEQPWASPTPTPGGIESAGPIYAYGLTVSQGRVNGKGLVSDYRTGYLTLTQEAVYIQGQAVLPNNTRMLILVPLVLLGWPLAVLVSVILEYAARRTQFSRLEWENIREIVLEPKKGRVCVAYIETGKTKPVYSLGFKPGAYYDNFAQAARYFAPEKVREGKIGPANSPWVYVALGLFAAMIIAALVFFAQN